MRKVAGYEALEKPGDYYFDKDAKHFVGYLPGIPDKMQAVAVIPVESGNPSSWQFNGNHDRPTLRPSILHKSQPAWHGYVTDGVMVDC